MSVTASRITSLTIVYSIVYSGADQRNIKAPRHWPLRGIHRWPVNSPHKWQVKRKMFPFDDIIMSAKNRFTKQVKKCQGYVHAPILNPSIPFRDCGKHQIIVNLLLCVTNLTNPKMHLCHLPKCTIHNSHSVPNGALWGMTQVHCGIHQIGLWYETNYHHHLQGLPHIATTCDNIYVISKWSISHVWLIIGHAILVVNTDTSILVDIIKSGHWNSLKDQTPVQDLQMSSRLILGLRPLWDLIPQTWWMLYTIWATTLWVKITLATRIISSRLNGAG